MNLNNNGLNQLLEILISCQGSDMKLTKFIVFLRCNLYLINIEGCSRVYQYLEIEVSKPAGFNLAGLTITEVY